MNKIIQQGMHGNILDLLGADKKHVDLRDEEGSD